MEISGARHSSAETLRRIRELLPGIMPPGARVTLYGSRARGDARQDSDWDLLIIVDKDGSPNDSDIRNVNFPLVMLGCDLNETISPQMYTREEWERLPFTPFRENIRREGIRIWG